MEPQEFDHRDDLEAFKQDFGAWWAKNGTKTLFLILIVVASYTAYKLYSLNQIESHESAWGDIASITSPDVAKNTASDHGEPVRSLLRLRAADLWLEKSALPQNDEAPIETEGDAEVDADNPLGSIQAMKDDKTPEQMLAEAKELYQQVAEQKNIHLTIQLNARLGMGAVAESEKRWDDAAQIYEGIESDAGEDYKALAAQAAGRLDMVNRMRKPVRYATDVPAPAPPAPAQQKPTAPLLNLPSTDFSGDTDPVPSTDLVPAQPESDDASGE